MRFPRTILLVGLTVGLLGASVTRADETGSNAKLNKKIDNLTFKDADGRAVTLHDLKDKKAVVLVFLSFECPVSNSYAPFLNEFVKKYGPNGVAFVALAVNDETPAEIAKRTQEFKLTFPAYKDDGFKAANALQAEMTPEAFVLDHNFVLRYRGRIDDGYYARLKKNIEVKNHDLKNALDDLLAGKDVRQPITKAVGCTIPRDGIAKAPTGQVTYHRDVAVILQKHCQDCHRPGDVGPFALLTYKQAVNWAGDIKEYTHNRKMPPWKPNEGLAFHNERRLTDKELATIAAWVDGGTPEGNAKDAPAPRQFTSGWHLGQPDVVLTMPDDFTLGPAGRDIFRCFVLPTNLPDDAYVSAIEVKPGNARVVHHTLLFIDRTGSGRKLEAKQQSEPRDPNGLDSGPGYSKAMGVGFAPQGALGGWAPGQVPRHLPEGSGFFLPKGADVVMQMHYHRNGRVEKDRTQVGLYLVKKPVNRRYQSAVIPGRFISIPPNNENFRVAGDIWIDQDCSLYSVMPHMHLLGRKVKVTMTAPDGKQTTLVRIDDWDYNWQETYWFKQPIQVKAGSKFSVEAFYDNSSKNPSNPSNPPKHVFFGEQTTNEMCFVFMGGLSEQPGGRLRFRLSEPSKVTPK